MSRILKSTNRKLVKLWLVDFKNRLTMLRTNNSLNKRKFYEMKIQLKVRINLVSVKFAHLKIRKNRNSLKWWLNKNLSKWKFFIRKMRLNKNILCYINSAEYKFWLKKIKNKKIVKIFFSFFCIVSINEFLHNRSIFSPCVIIRLCLYIIIITVCYQLIFFFFAFIN